MRPVGGAASLMIRAVGPSTLIRSRNAALVVTTAFASCCSLTNAPAISFVSLAASIAVTALARTETIWDAPTRLTVVLDLDNAIAACLLLASEDSGSEWEAFQGKAYVLGDMRSYRTVRP